MDSSSADPARQYGIYPASPHRSNEALPPRKEIFGSAREGPGALLWCIGRLGGSYGTIAPAVWRQAARLVDRILNGAAPRDLPVEQPTSFELVTNARTAKTLGLTVSPSLPVRADESKLMRYAGGASCAGGSTCNSETAGVHHAARRCGCVAARGARAAARPATAKRRRRVSFSVTAGR